MSIFSRGLTRALRPIANRRRENFTGPNCLRKFAEELTAYQDTHNELFRAHRPKVRDGRSTTAALVDAESGSRSIFRGPIRPALTDPIALVGTGADEHPRSRLEGTRTTTSSTDTDSPRPPTRESTQQYLSSKADSILLSTVAAAAHMGPGALREKRSNNRPNPSPAPVGSPARSHERQSSIPLICYLCFFEGHMARECPHREHATEPAYLAFFRANWESLPVWMQEYLKAQNRGYRYPRAQQGLRRSSREPSPNAPAGAQRLSATRSAPELQARPVAGNAASGFASNTASNRKHSAPTPHVSPPVHLASTELAPAPMAPAPETNSGPGN